MISSKRRWLIASSLLTLTVLIAAKGEAGDQSPAILRFFGRLHPLTVHFPIALIIVAGFFEAGSLRSGRERWRDTAHLCLGLGALSAVAAAALGWLNAETERQSASLADDLFWHRWLGVAVANLACVSWGLATLARSGGRAGLQRAYRVTLGLTVVLLSFASHLGGTLVHGEGYLTDIFKQSSPSPADSGSSGVDKVELPAHLTSYETHIRPIFDRSCIECHGADKKKGNLRLDLKEEVFKGDELDWTIVPGDAEGSPLVELISLPADDPDVMPSEGDLLPKEEIDLIRRWIDAGAHWTPEEAIAADGAKPKGAEDG